MNNELQEQPVKQLTLVVPVTKEQNLDPIIKMVGDQIYGDFDVAIICNEQRDEPFVLHVPAETTQEQLNKYISKDVTTSHFAVLFPEDILHINWAGNVVGMIDSDSRADMFVPITYLHSPDTNASIFANEAVWAHGVTTRIGFFEFEPVVKKKMHGFSMAGASIKTQTFKELGGFKPNLNHYWREEFAYRMLYQKRIVRGIGRICATQLVYKYNNELEMIDSHKKAKEACYVSASAML